MNIPTPPLNSTNADLKKSLTDTLNFLQLMFNNGTKHAGFTQAQIDAITNLDQAGTIVFNTTTNESNVSYIETGLLKWRAF